MPSARQWRRAALELRDYAAKWEQLACEQEHTETELFAAVLAWDDADSLLDREHASLRLHAAVEAWRRPTVDVKPSEGVA